MNLYIIAIMLFANCFIAGVAIWDGWAFGMDIALSQPRACSIQEIVRELPGDYIGHGLRRGFVEDLRRPRWSEVSL